jgi:hypothetical protein
MQPRVTVIRVFQIAGACAIIVYCLVQLGQDAHLPQTDIMWQHIGRVRRIERWQADVIYGIFIILCGSLIIHVLRANGSDDDNSKDEHDNI